MAEEEAAKMAEEAFAEAGVGGGEGTGEGTFFESVKTSLPGLGESYTDGWHADQTDLRI